MSMGARKKILVVEIDDFLRSAFETFCSSYAPTLAVSNAKDAIDALDLDFSIVVIGIHHDDSGLAVLEKIRERRANLPVLVVTRDASIDISPRARELKADILPYPITQRILKSFSAKR